MNILQEAANIVDKDRGKIYGPAEVGFQRTAAMWSALLGVEVSAKQVCMCMIALKLQRLSVSPDHRDSLVDIVGYASLMEVV